MSYCEDAIKTGSSCDWVMPPNIIAGGIPSSNH